jgi:hypothetical protein
MWYLRDVLLLPDARLAKMAKTEEKTEKGEKAKKGGFFKNLFGKKKKKKSDAETDSTQQLKAEVIDYGYDDFEGKAKDSTNVDETPNPAAVDQPKKKEKKKKADKKKETTPAKKEEDDDGF